MPTALVRRDVSWEPCQGLRDTQPLDSTDLWVNLCQRQKAAGNVPSVGKMPLFRNVHTESSAVALSAGAERIADARSAALVSYTVGPRGRRVTKDTSCARRRSFERPEDEFRAPDALVSIASA